MADAAAPKPPRKLPFKRTTVRTPTATPTTSIDKGKGKENEAAPDASPQSHDSLALFRRSKEMAPRIAADRERRLAKMKQKEDKQRHVTSSGEKRSFEELSDDNDPQTPDDQAEKPGAASPTVDEPAMAGNDGSEMVTPPSSKRSRISPPTKRDESPASESPSTRRTRSNVNFESPRKPAKPEITPTRIQVVDLDSDSDADPFEDSEVQVVTSISKSPPPSNTEPAENEAVDEEFSEYILLAEQRAKDLEAEGPGKPKAEVLVTSEIEGSKPLRLRIFFDQKMLLLRQAWSTLQTRNNIPVPVDVDDLVLTWRQEKVYPHSTLRDLEIRPSSTGGVYTTNFSRKGLTEDGTKVQMEMWTPELFQKWEREEAERRRRREDEDYEEDFEEEQEPAAPEVKLRVILEARGYEEVKLTVRPATTVETLVTGFRSLRNIPAEKQITLWFDGELMEEHVTMEEADIDDEDKIEVHVK